jgi:hypothetical protein
MDDHQDAFTVPEFCARHRFGRAFYYKLKNLGLGPKEMRVGARVLISREAAAAWRRDRETVNASSAAA